MPTPARSRRALGTRAAAAVAIVLCGLAAVLTLFALVLDTEAVQRRVVDHVLPRASEALGREIHLESAKARLLPRPEVTLRALRVEGRPGEPPLLEAPEVAVELSLWTLLRSFGREVHVNAVRISAPELNLLRDRSGVWNFEGLGPQPPTGQPAPGSRAFTLGRAQIEDGTVNVIDRSSAHGEATVALTRLDVTARAPEIDGPLQLQLNAAVASEAQNLSMDLEVDRTQPHPRVEGYLALTRAQLTRLEGLLPARLGTVLMGGHVDVDGRVGTAPDGAWTVDAHARLDEVRLRAEPASGELTLKGRVDPADPTGARVEVESLSLRGPGLELGGRAALTFSPTAVEFALKGPLLDLDALLAALPEEELQSPPSRTSLLPARTRRTLDEVRAQGTLRVDRVVRGGLELTGLDARAQLRRGVLTLTRAEAALYDGRIDASGSSANLLLAQPGWTLSARLEDVDVGKLGAAVAARAPLQGKLDAAMSLEGEGVDWALVQENVRGTGVLALSEGELGSVALGERVAGVAAEALQRLGRTGAAGRAEQAERALAGTPLRDLTMTFRVEDGRMSLREPLALAAPFGGARLEGSIGLDTTLDLRGQALLSGQFLAERLGLRGADALEVPLTIGGTLSDPDVQLPSPAEVAAGVAAPAARAGAKRVEEEVRRRARQGVGDVLRRLGRGD